MTPRLPYSSLNDMFFFHFTGETKASAAVREYLRAEKLTYEQFCEKVGVSRSTISQFRNGRPLSPKLMAKILSKISGEPGRKILYGHLLDEAHRVGVDPDTISIISTQPLGTVVSEFSNFISGNPAYAVEAIAMMEKWKRGSKNSPIATPEETIVQSKENNTTGGLVTSSRDLRD